MLFKRITSAIAFLVLVIATILPASLTYADTTSSASAVVATPTRAQLQSQLEALNKQIADEQAIINDNQNQQRTLKSTIAVLNAQIKEAQLSIEARNLQIRSLNDSIAQKEQVIGQLSAKITREKLSLASLLRAQADIDSTSLIEVVLSDASLSSFFSDVDNFDSIKSKLQDSYNQVTSDVSTNQAEEQDLQNQQQEQTDLLSIQKLQQQRLKQTQSQEQQLLTQTKGQETKYQQVLASSQKSAAAIRAQLFSLSGSAAIPFDKAVQYAKAASSKTGVPAAFILAIVAEESDLGNNIGTGNWRTDMKAPRDTVPFVQICQSLGLDPDRMPVSKKPWYGWGGAMGPAQFIPSTWVLYEDQISQLTGDSPANPWAPQDAFMASALLSRDNGAASSSNRALRLAALRYLAGKANASNPAYAFYGDDVMSLMAKYQNDMTAIGD
jgi:peptidoglycan hydrolase CwlO-like protein